jgi:predicted nucleotidyltransferase
MFKVEKDILENLKREILVVTKNFPVRKAVIYGSVAYGNERPDSDIDLLLVVEKKGTWMERLQNMLRVRILELFGNTLSMIVCTPSEYKKMARGLKKEIEGGIVVFGD